MGVFFKESESESVLNRFLPSTRQENLEVKTFVLDRYRTLKDNEQTYKRSVIFRQIAEEVKKRFPSKAYYKECNIRSIVNRHEKKGG